MNKDPEGDEVKYDRRMETEKLIQVLLLSSNMDISISSDPQFTDCVTKLSHLRANELAITPKRIQREEDNIQHKTEQLAVENYPIFLANANTSRDVHRDFVSITESNDNLLSCIASVSSAAQVIFDNVGKNASAFRVSARSVQKYTQISEFLELPELMETCIQNGYYQDALNILNHTRHMAKKYGRMVPIVRLVGLQAHEISGQLFNQLCKQLREPISLPTCLKVIIYLRQLEAFTEQELRLNFLQARDICIRDQLEAALSKPIGLSNFDSSTSSTTTRISGCQQAEYKAFIRAMRRIEVTRVQLFDSITQYRAVFADEETYLTRLTDPHQQPSLSDISPLHLDETTLTLRYLITNGIDDLGPCNEGSLFHSWLVRQIGIFLDGLSEDLNALLRLPHFTSSDVSDRIQLAMTNDSISLDTVDVSTAFQQIHSIMTQALYFGRSFARIGCDFRAHLGSLFSKKILAYFETLLTNALTELGVVLELWPWELVEQSYLVNQLEEVNSEELPAPLDIARHPPIAFFCNRLLTVFNGLQICCPFGLKDGILSACLRTLSGAAETIVSVHKSRQIDSTATRAQHTHLASVFALVATPHLLTCLLEHIFGGDAALSLWQLRLEEETEVLSSSHTISILSRQVCASIFEVWGHLITATGTPTWASDKAESLQQSLAYPDGAQKLLKSPVEQAHTKGSLSTLNTELDSLPNEISHSSEENGNVESELKVSSLPKENLSPDILQASKTVSIEPTISVSDELKSLSSEQVDSSVATFEDKSPIQQFLDLQDSVNQDFQPGTISEMKIVSGSIASRVFDLTHDKTAPSEIPSNSTISNIEIESGRFQDSTQSVDFAETSLTLQQVGTASNPSVPSLDKMLSRLIEDKDLTPIEGIPRDTAIEPIAKSIGSEEVINDWSSEEKAAIVRITSENNSKELLTQESTLDTVASVLPLHQSNNEINENVASPQLLESRQALTPGVVPGSPKPQNCALPALSDVNSNGARLSEGKEDEMKKEFSSLTAFNPDDQERPEFSGVGGSESTDQDEYADSFLGAAMCTDILNFHPETSPIVESDNTGDAFPISNAEEKSRKNSIESTRVSEKSEDKQDLAIQQDQQSSPSSDEPSAVPSSEVSIGIINNSNTLHISIEDGVGELNSSTTDFTPPVTVVFPSILGETSGSSWKEEGNDSVYNASELNKEDSIGGDLQNPVPPPAHLEKQSVKKVSETEESGKGEAQPVDVYLAEDDWNDNVGTEEKLEISDSNDFNKGSELNVSHEGNISNLKKDEMLAQLPIPDNRESVMGRIEAGDAKASAIAVTSKEEPSLSLETEDNWGFGNSWDENAKIPSDVEGREKIHECPNSDQGTELIEPLVEYSNVDLVKIPLGSTSIIRMTDNFESSVNEKEDECLQDSSPNTLTVGDLRVDNFEKEKSFEKQEISAFLESHSTRNDENVVLSEKDRTYLSSDYPVIETVSSKVHLKAADLEQNVLLQNMGGVDQPMSLDSESSEVVTSNKSVSQSQISISEDFNVGMGNRLIHDSENEEPLPSTLLEATDSVELNEDLKHIEANESKYAEWNENDRSGDEPMTSAHFQPLHKNTESLARESESNRQSAQSVYTFEFDDSLNVDQVLTSRTADHILSSTEFSDTRGLAIGTEALESSLDNKISRNPLLADFGGDTNPGQHPYVPDLECHELNKQPEDRNVPSKAEESVLKPEDAPLEDDVWGKSAWDNDADISASVEENYELAPQEMTNSSEVASDSMHQGSELELSNARLLGCATEFSLDEAQRSSEYEKVVTGNQRGSGDVVPSEAPVSLFKQNPQMDDSYEKEDKTVLVFGALSLRNSSDNWDDDGAWGDEVDISGVVEEDEMTQPESNPASMDAEIKGPYNEEPSSAQVAEAAELVASDDVSMGSSGDPKKVEGWDLDF